MSESLTAIARKYLGPKWEVETRGHHTMARVKTEPGTDNNEWFSISLLTLESFLSILNRKSYLERTMNR